MPHSFEVRLAYLKGGVKWSSSIQVVGWTNRHELEYPLPRRPHVRPTPLEKDKLSTGSQCCSCALINRPSLDFHGSRTVRGTFFVCTNEDDVSDHYRTDDVAASDMERAQP